jgi:ATP-dependent DNA helicase RecQ
MEAIAEGELCREQALLLSVGELTAPCGRCDRCLAELVPKDWSDRAQELLEVIDTGRGDDIRCLIERLREINGSEDRWGWLVRRLVQEELIHESNDGVQRLSLRDSGRQFLQSPWPLHYSA